MKTKRKRINLGLQGGGSHAAIAWGVLDYLLEDGRLDIEGISATGSGSMNAIVLADGMLHQDRDHARQALHDFWTQISNAQKPFQLQSLFNIPWLNTDKYSPAHSPAYLYFDFMTHIFSPYQFNPFNMNPLKDILEKSIDFEALKAQSEIKLFISATNVKTCKVKIFTNQELSTDAILASACLPTIFQAVEIDGQYYWNGGYIGNPAIFPLIYHCDSKDVLIVHITPIRRPGLPKTPSEILNRINEISFNSSLMREMRAIAFVSDLIDSKNADGLNLKKMHMHSIRSDEEMVQYDISTKMNANWDFLTHLRDRGRHFAQQWMQENFSKIGKKSSIDIRKEYL